MTTYFTVSNGQILTPSGAVFVARGINISDSNMAEVSTNTAGAPLTALYPGINFIRLACYSFQAYSAYETFVNQMTALGIVVEFEDHTNSTGGDAGGGAGVVFTGTELTNESNWYASIATAALGNPYVWFGTNNEPSYSPSLAALSTWHEATYNAIRATGNGTIILICLPAGGNPGTFGAGNGLTSSVYAAMTGVAWDYHQYSWLYNGQSDTVSVATMYSMYEANVTEVQTIHSAQGVMPVVTAEYGISTTGVSPDASGTNMVTVVQNAAGVFTSGCAAWHWGQEGGSDNLSSTNAGGTLTSYGQQVAAFIAAGAAPVSTPTPTPTPEPTPVTASPNDTTVLAGSTAAITDAAGNLWTITSGGQVAVNGTADTTTSGVVELAYVSGTVWQENGSKLWWGKTSPTAAWSPAAGTSTSPLPATTTTPPPTTTGPTPAQVQALIATVTTGTNTTLSDLSTALSALTTAATSLNSAVSALNTMVTELSTINTDVGEL